MVFLAFINTANDEFYRNNFVNEHLMVLALGNLRFKTLTPKLHCLKIDSTAKMHSSLKKIRFYELRAIT